MQEEQCHTLRLRNPKQQNIDDYIHHQQNCIIASEQGLAVCENVCGEEFSCAVIRCRSL